jgi:WhiB family redox-sensing transcriptional regulator
MSILQAPLSREGPAGLTDRELLAQVTSRRARCAGAGVDPDEWFPITAEAGKARSQAARALALCAACPVRAECLELSLRHWNDIGQHGVWGGLVEAERRGIRDQWLTGASVTELLWPEAREDVRAASSRPPARRGAPADDWRG